MSSLDRVAVAVQGAANTAMVDAILQQIAEGLARYLESGERVEIDLLGLPLTAADRMALEKALGRGEVHITLEVMGESEVVETGFSGVWWIRHRDQQGRTVANLVEICAVPAIVVAEEGEMVHALERLQGR